MLSREVALMQCCTSLVSDMAHASRSANFQPGRTDVFEQCVRESGLLDKWLLLMVGLTVSCVICRVVGDSLSFMAFSGISR